MRTANRTRFLEPEVKKPTVITLRLLTRLAILDALDRNHGSHAKAARELGIGRTTLWRCLKKWGEPCRS